MNKTTKLTLVVIILWAVWITSKVIVLEAWSNQFRLVIEAINGFK